ncbi:TPA: hypothetical protein RI785_002268 [Vibrio cholerae]|uniref:Uncharacterized protein n=1 Tax=Vibrio cholerae TaxID=666 RepID=A0A5Q6PDX7_VIBCL|nr:hypothetical protein [Vibrio cholerae]KAA1253078.1 hypothetical protein F0M16_19240 [Vibrio cholerae]HDV5593550.1 hypothetical protein [Vibrio cholerae]
MNDTLEIEMARQKALFENEIKKLSPEGKVMFDGVMKDLDALWERSFTSTNNVEQKSAAVLAFSVFMYKIAD